MHCCCECIVRRFNASNVLKSHLLIANELVTFLNAKSHKKKKKKKGKRKEEGKEGLISVSRASIIHSKRKKGKKKKERKRKGKEKRKKEKEKKKERTFFAQKKIDLKSV